MSYENDVSLELKRFFKAKRLSQYDIADRLGTSQQYVQKLISKGAFSKGAAQKWADAFGLNAAWLMTGEGNMLKDDTIETTTNKVVTEFSQTIANEILKLVSDGILYPSNVMEERNKEIKEKDQEIKRLSIEVGALRAELEILKKQQNG